MKNPIYSFAISCMLLICFASCSDDDNEQLINWQLNEELSDNFDSWNPEKWGPEVWVTSSV